MIAVRIAPARTPRMVFWNNKKRCRKAGTSARPATAPLMVSMPYISVAKPSRIVPVSFRLLSEQKRKSTMPMRARIGVKEEGLSSWSSRLWPVIPARLKSQAVTVVPMFAPMMT